MNINNNSRYIDSKNKIINALLSLLRFKSFNNIFVKDVCSEAGIHRSTFYAHFTDINDLLIKTEWFLSKEITDIMQSNNTFNVQNFEQLFCFIKKYKNFYKAYLDYATPSFIEAEMYNKFKLPLLKITRQGQYHYSEWEFDFHMRFFAGGLKSICKLWIDNDCKQTPQQMAKLIHDEYKNNSIFFEAK